jgi:hypothetical protein
MQGLMGFKDFTIFNRKAVSCQHHYASTWISLSPPVLSKSPVLRARACSAGLALLLSCLRSPVGGGVQLMLMRQLHKAEPTQTITRRRADIALMLSQLFLHVNCITTNYLRVRGLWNHIYSVVLNCWIRWCIHCVHIVVLFFMHRCAAWTRTIQNDHKTDWRSLRPDRWKPPTYNISAVIPITMTIVTFLYMQPTVFSPYHDV